MNNRDNKLMVQAILRRNSLSFFERAVPTIMPNVEYLPNWHIALMADVFEEMVYGDLKRVIFNIHPRMAKSSFFSVSAPMFLLMQDPSCQIMCLSYSDQLASQFHQVSRLLSKQPWYRDLNPQLKFKSAGESSGILKETGSILQTTQLGHRQARSFGGSITGAGGDWIIMDDGNDMSQINSEAHRNKINETYDQSISTRLNNKEGRIVLVTQRGNINDLSGHLLEKGGFRHVKVEAIASERITYSFANHQSYTREKGELIDPLRFGPKEMEERRRDLGSAAFEAQYQQNPQPPEGNVFKRKWLKIVRKAPEFQYVIISGDIAGTQGRGDYSAFLVWGYFDEIWYLIAAHRDKLDQPGVVRLYRKLDEQYEPDFTIIEKNTIGSGFIDRMNELEYAHVQGETVSGDKVARAEGITPLLERKQVAFLKTMPLYEKFMDELLSFPSSKYDDMVDALTLALTYRQRILAVANYHRRQKRRNLPQARGSMPEVRITGFGERSSGVRDSYFERTGRSTFSRFGF